MLYISLRPLHFSLCADPLKTRTTLDTRLPAVMIPPLPVLQDYDISPDNGFLPPELPLTRLPDAYYKPWELVIESLPELISTKTVRAIVDRVPELSTNRLRTENEWRRAYVLLGFIAHGYIWGGEKPKDVCHPLQGIGRACANGPPASAEQHFNSFTAHR